MRIPYIMTMTLTGRRNIRRRYPAMASLCFASFILGPGFIMSPHLASPARAQESKPAADTKKEAGQKGGDNAKAGGKTEGLPQRRRGRGGPAVIKVDPVIQGMAVETVSVYGRIIAAQTGLVAVRTRGAIDTVPVRIGDRVKKGDVLATLVTDMLSAERALKAAELEENAASIKTVGAQLQLASQELERLERLRKSAAFSVARYQDKLRDVERFRSSITEARAKTDQAKAELRMADINLYNSKILAPYDGVVTQRHVEAGNFVSVGAPIVSLVNDSALEVEGEVPTNRIGGLSPGVPIEVIPEHGSPFKAAVRAVVPEENALARTRLVRFSPSFEQREDTVAANQSVILQIPSGKPREIVSVHKDAITQRRGKRVVFVFDADAKQVKMREVELGQAFGSRFEVLKGISIGDPVVVLGNERLRPNQPARLLREGGRGRGSGEGRRRSGGGENGQPRSENRPDGSPDGSSSDGEIGKRRSDG